MELDPLLARAEPDYEIRMLIQESAGLNLGLDFLPAALPFDPALHRPEAPLASAIVWLDAFLTNVDRTARNTNMLMWHGNLWLLDHGASLYFQHNWADYLSRARSPFPAIKSHVLLQRASALAEVDATFSARLDEATLREIVALIPDAWLDEPLFPSAEAHRAAFVAYLTARLAPPRAFVEEAINARDGLV